MKTTIRLFSIVLAFLSVALSPQARAACQDGCLANANTVQGDNALISLTTGGLNAGFGFNALQNNTTGVLNTAIGYEALMLNTEGGDNTAIGGEALFFNSTGGSNTAVGVSASRFNTTGNSNTAVGSNALFSNGTGSGNTAVGWSAMTGGDGGNDNTAVGFSALQHGPASSNNTAIGSNALFSTFDGSSNTATGFNALSRNVNGSSNAATGFNALQNNRTGSFNTAFGARALFHNQTGSFNIALGSKAGINLTLGDNNIDIGNDGVTGEAATIRVGTTGTQTNTFVAGISGAIVPTGVAVIVDTDGHLGTTISSARFKEAIKPMDKASEAILALNPVTFRYKQNLDPNGTPQFGLVAEDVEKVNPDLVARDQQGKPYTVRYDAVNAMLLNEFLKEHKAFVEEQRKVQEQGASIARLQKQVEALTVGLQK
jgi:hypothetical protein